MHECPMCGEVCYCDLEDSLLPVPDECTHICADPDDWFSDDSEDEGE